MDKVYIKINEPTTFRGRPITEHIWFEVRAKTQRHFFRQRKGGKVIRITDQRQKDDLLWYFHRYRADGSRI